MATTYNSADHSELNDVILWEQAAGGDTPIQNTAQDYRMLIDALYNTEGGIGNAGKLVPPSGGGNNLDITPGFLVLPSNYTGGGKYLAKINSTFTVAVPAWTSGTQYTRVTAKALDKADGGDSAYGFSVTVDSGSSDPGVPSGSVSLGLMTRTSAAAITSAMIADKYRTSSVSPGTCVARIYYSLDTAVAAANSVPFNHEDWDTLNGHDNSSNNHRYTPTVPGKYKIEGAVVISNLDPGSPTIAAGKAISSEVWKNTAAAYDNSDLAQAIADSAGSFYSAPFSEVVQMNGTTDYVHVHWNYAPDNFSKRLTGSYMNVTYVGA